jgi:hypothetical protein
VPFHENRHMVPNLKNACALNKEIMGGLNKMDFGMGI